MPECWNVLECSLEYREKCAAHPFKGDQCWSVVVNRECAESHGGDGESRSCVECMFFQVMTARKQLGGSDAR